MTRKERDSYWIPVYTFNFQLNCCQRRLATACIFPRIPTGLCCPFSRRFWKDWYQIASTIPFITLESEMLHQIPFQHTPILLIRNKKLICVSFLLLALDHSNSINYYNSYIHFCQDNSYILHLFITVESYILIHNS